MQVLTGAAIIVQVGSRCETTQVCGIDQCHRIVQFRTRTGAGAARAVRGANVANTTWERLSLSFLSVLAVLLGGFAEFWGGTPWMGAGSGEKIIFS